MKKVLSIVLSLVMLLSVAAPVSAYAASVGQVKNVKVVSTTSSTVKLKWKKVKGATGYQVYYSTMKSKGYKKGATVKKGKTVTATVKKLKSNKKYYFKVRAVKKKKKGKYSKVVSAKTKSANYLTSDKAKTLYLNAEKEASGWLFGFCEYASIIGEICIDKGTNTWACPVSHSSVNSVATLKKHLSNYFDESVYNSYVNKHYIDYNNKLYFTGDGLGGPYDYKLKSTSVISQNANTATVKITISERDSKYNKSTGKTEYYEINTITRTLSLEYKNGKWIFKNPFYVLFGASQVQ